MYYSPTNIQDKLGRTIVLRSAGPEDAEDLICYLKATSAETPYLLREPEEVTITPEQEVSFLKGILDSPPSTDAGCSAGRSCHWQLLPQPCRQLSAAGPPV